MAENYNTALIFDREGRLVAKHRKTMPTFPEKLTWSFGDGSSLRVYATDIGKLGVLNCGENGNSLLRYALIAQGEQVHVANYPALAALSEGAGMYDFWRGVEIRTAAHAFEGKLFNIVSSAVLDDEAKRVLCDTPDKQACFRERNNSLTAVYGPAGVPIAPPVEPDREGIAYADVDLAQILAHMLFHDIAGNYMRADIVSLNLNRRPLRPIWETAGPATVDGIVNGVSEQLAQLLEEARALGATKTVGALSRAVAELAERATAG
jgi:aliphatic nitrilase